MFLHIISHNLKNSTIKFFYHRSGETVSRQFQSVLRLVLRLHKDFLKLHKLTLDEHDVNKWKWFKNCLGALNGTYVNLIVPIEDQPRYRNRKYDISKKVLGVCDPNMKFIWWEGTASDSQVLRDALRRHNRFQVPSGMEQTAPISQGEQKGKGKKNIPWNADMDNILVEILFDQMAIGNEADPGWKPQAYRAAMNTLNARFNISINKENVKNRLKSWGKHYTIVSEIIKQNGFSWDTHKKMITVDDKNVWNEYVKDKANGEGAENDADPNEVMLDEEVSDVEPTSMGLDDIGVNEVTNSPTTRA
ncbi:hypothetical protein HHK36_013658 [Tetracentron sinense]|uniref:Myb/SANT-like domain-containing protein n=1 Tax=Tetracentron sinense TaxID=13715 RepID=A0A834Z6E8_TETSI|nr:hypothetical protein HHK36_013658 [Tetracentron sinense]